jgi:hypothetical protein
MLLLEGAAFEQPERVPMNTASTPSPHKKQRIPHLLSQEAKTPPKK